MDDNYEVLLTVNRIPVELSGFPEHFLLNILAAFVYSLKHTQLIKTLHLTLNYGKVKLKVNDTQIPLKPFPNLAIASTLIEMASTFKGVTGKVTSLEIRVI